MTIVEAIQKAEEIAGTIPVVGRQNVTKMNDIFSLLDASIAALTQPPQEGAQDGNPA